MKHLVLITLIIFPLLAMAQPDNGMIRVEIDELKLRYDDIKSTTKNLLFSYEANVFKDYGSDLGRLKRNFDSLSAKLDSLSRGRSNYVLINKKLLDSLQFLLDTLAYAYQASDFSVKQNAVSFGNCSVGENKWATWQLDIGGTYKTTPLAIKIFRSNGTEDTQSFYNLIYHLKGTPAEKNILNNVKSGDMRKIIIGDCLFFLKKGDTTIVDGQPEDVIVSTKEIRFIIPLGSQ